MRQTQPKTKFIITVKSSKAYAFPSSKIAEPAQKKLILVIPAHMRHYLDWINSKQHHRSEVVRKALMNMIENDSEYQDYLNDL